jgi:type II secretory pathway component PulF
MPVFTYKALAADGGIQEGSCEAANRQTALADLAAQGLKPIKVLEGASAAAESGLLGVITSFFAGLTEADADSVGKASPAELEAFTRQLSSLLAAGVPLARALKHLAEETSSEKARRQWRAVHDLAVGGSSLADAMAQYPQTFPKVYCAMVHAGETGGFLDVVLDQIAEFQANEKELKGRMGAALTYPAVLALLCTAVVTFLMVFFIPKFDAIFADFGASLPILTQVVVGASKAVTTYGVWLAVPAVLAGVLALRWLSGEAGHRAWQKALLNIPIIGPLNARFAMTRFCRMLGTLIGAGVPLISSLRVAQESLGNLTLVDAVRESINDVQKGSRLADSLAKCPQLFPRSVLEIIAVSEQAGRLEKELTRLADVTEKNLDRQLRTTLALAEPAMLFVMAAVIGVIVIGMVLPIFELQDYIK